ncbi:trypsin, partial [Staphylococcus pseudintermedius]
ATDISDMPGYILAMPSTDVSTQSKVHFNNTDKYGDFLTHFEIAIGIEERKNVTSFTSSPIIANAVTKVERKNYECDYDVCVK